MLTYGYLREATLAHLDLEEDEAQSMNLLSRFHIFANEAMQAICASKPQYKYINITVVEKYDPLVMDGSFLRKATVEELEDEDTVYASEELVDDYYKSKNIYLTNEKVSIKDDMFIALVDRQAYKYVELNLTCKKEIKMEVDKRDLSYGGKNQITFYKPGKYEIPAIFMWYQFTSAQGDKDEIDMPNDIFLTIPLYIASVCLQIDNPTRAQIKRNEFEIALTRCTNTDFMPLTKISRSW